MVKESKSFVKDTSDFIRKIEGIDNLHTNSIIGTMDVTSLYTNIPNDEGVASIAALLEKDRDKEINPKNGTPVDILDFVLKNNNFQFNGENYHQISGTAMGTRVAPSYANLFMTALETKLIDNYRLKPKVWFRYIDDVFFIWEHGEEELTKWLSYLSKLPRHHGEDEGRWFPVYRSVLTKPTATNSYLLYTSATCEKGSTLQPIPQIEENLSRRKCL